MKHFSSITVLITAAALSMKTTHAFSAQAASPSGRTSTRLHSTSTAGTDKDRIKKSGAGITMQTPGDLCFYDPNENGKLQGSNTLMDRIENGASFSLSGDAVVKETTPPPPATVVTPPGTAVTPPSIPTTNTITTNLTKLLNQQMGTGFRTSTSDNSQY